MRRISESNPTPSLPINFSVQGFPNINDRLPRSKFSLSFSPIKPIFPLLVNTQVNSSLSDPQRERITPWSLREREAFFPDDVVDPLLLEQFDPENSLESFMATSSLTTCVWQKPNDNTRHSKSDSFLILYAHGPCMNNLGLCSLQEGLRKQIEDHLSSHINDLQNVEMNGVVSKVCSGCIYQVSLNTSPSRPYLPEENPTVGVRTLNYCSFFEVKRSRVEENDDGNQFKPERFSLEKILDLNFKKWIYHFAFSPYGDRTEVSFVTQDGGVYVWDRNFESGKIRTIRKCKQKSGDEKNQEEWYQCEYASHPQVLYVADKKSVSKIDFREPSSKCFELFSVGIISKYPPSKLLIKPKVNYGNRIFGIKRHPREAFHLIIATTLFIFVIDERFPNYPLLVYEYFKEEPPFHLEVKCIDLSEGENTLIFVGNRVDDCLLVFQYESSNHKSNEPHQDLDKTEASQSSQSVLKATPKAKISLSRTKFKTMVDSLFEKEFSIPTDRKNPPLQVQTDPFNSNKTIRELQVPFALPSLITEEIKRTSITNPSYSRKPRTHLFGFSILLDSLNSLQMGSNEKGFSCFQISSYGDVYFQSFYYFLGDSSGLPEYANRLFDVPTELIHMALEKRKMMRPKPLLSYDLSDFFSKMLKTDQVSEVFQEKHKAKNSSRLDTGEKKEVLRSVREYLTEGPRSLFDIYTFVKDFLPTVTVDYLEIILDEAITQQQQQQHYHHHQQQSQQQSQQKAGMSIHKASTMKYHSPLDPSNKPFTTVYQLIATTTTETLPQRIFKSDLVRAQQQQPLTHFRAPVLIPYNSFSQTESESPQAFSQSQSQQQQQQSSSYFQSQSQSHSQNRAGSQQIQIQTRPSQSIPNLQPFHPLSQQQQQQPQPQPQDPLPPLHSQNFEDEFFVPASQPLSQQQQLFSSSSQGSSSTSFVPDSQPLSQSQLSLSETQPSQTRLNRPKRKHKEGF